MKKKPRTLVWSNTPASLIRRKAMLNQLPNYKDQPINRLNLCSTLLHKRSDCEICKAYLKRTKFWIIKGMSTMEFWSRNVKIDWLGRNRRRGIVNLVIQILSVEMARSWLRACLRRKLRSSRRGIRCSTPRITHWARMFRVWKTSKARRQSSFKRMTFHATSPSRNGKAIQSLTRSSI